MKEDEEIKYNVSLLTKGKRPLFTIRLIKDNTDFSLYECKKIYDELYYTNEPITVSFRKDINEANEIAKQFKEIGHIVELYEAY